MMDPGAGKVASRCVGAAAASSGFVVICVGVRDVPVLDVTVEALSFGSLCPAFGLPAEPLGFGFADQVFAAGPVEVEFAEDELSSEDVSAAAVGAGPLANAIPTPSAKVAAAARVLSIAGFIESSDLAVSALSSAPRALNIYQQCQFIGGFKLSVKPFMAERSARGRSPITQRHKGTR
jgi:hypothetical protein